jgi:hypothetical protein
VDWAPLQSTLPSSGCGLRSPRQLPLLSGPSCSIVRTASSTRMSRTQRHIPNFFPILALEIVIALEAREVPYFAAEDRASHDRGEEGRPLRPHQRHNGRFVASKHIDDFCGGSVAASSLRVSPTSWIAIPPARVRSMASAAVVCEGSTRKTAAKLQLREKMDAKAFWSGCPGVVRVMAAKPLKVLVVRADRDFPPKDFYRFFSSSRARIRACTPTTRTTRTTKKLYESFEGFSPVRVPRAKT